MRFSVRFQCARGGPGGTPEKFSVRIYTPGGSDRSGDGGGEGARGTTPAPDPLAGVSTILTR